jgi:hypothetical protein
MKSYRLPFVAAIAICLASCKNDSSENKFAKLNKMKWLVGNWEQKLPDGTITESWSKENDSTYAGKSYFIKEKDTIHLESIVLTQKNDEVLYIPTVSGQNNNEPVTFTLVNEAENNTFSFENPAHDYPQKIVYKKINDTNLLATISGKQQGKDTKESYPMVKK